MIYFHKVRWKNFLSTGNVFTEVNLQEHPNTLIIGENGAGKSTILDALHYSLYGKPFRKVKKDQLINSVNRRECITEIELTVNGKLYKVVRGMKPTIFEIYEDGLLVDQNAASKDYQEHLENNILRMNAKSFSQIVILGSSSFVPFMQLTTAVRREVIEDLLDIRIFSAMQSLLKERISTNKEEISLNNKDIDSIHELIKLQEEQVKRDKEHTQGKLEDHRNRIAQLEDVIIQHGNTITAQRDAITQVQSTITDEGVVDELISRTASIKNDLKAKRAKSKKAIDFYKENATCPTCTQEISEQLRTKTVEKKQLLLDKIDVAIAELDQKISETDTRLREIQEVHNKISDIQQKITSIQNEIQKDQREIGVIQREIETIQSHTADESDVKLHELNDRRESYHIKKEKMLQHREVLDMANIILRDSGIKSRIIKQYVPIINSLVNKYLAAMDFFVKFELNENFEERILSRHRDDFTYESFSEGEKMRIDLSLLFTWRTISRMKNSAATNLLILDEVFDASLDANGCEEFLKLIHSLEDANVFVISHKGDIMQDKFRSTLKFEKHKNFSRISK
jgi:DNA repair exonuclease SbcCD ATPase subunit